VKERESEGQLRNETKVWEIERVTPNSADIYEVCPKDLFCLYNLLLTKYYTSIYHDS
jgi:hypothetical protein